MNDTELQFSTSLASASEASASGGMRSLTAVETDAAENEAAAEISEDDAMAIRTRQWNVFNVPVDTSGVYFDFFYVNDPFNRVRVSFHSIPAPLTTKEFNDLQAFATRFIGVPYAAGGGSPSTGFDCSGYVLYVLANCGGQMQARSCEAQLDFCHILEESQIMPGDLVFFVGTQSRESVSHVGIYLGDRKMIHAGMAGIGIVSLDEEYWQKHFYCFARPLR